MEQTLQVELLSLKTSESSLLRQEQRGAHAGWGVFQKAAGKASTKALTKKTDEEKKEKNKFFEKTNPGGKAFTPK